MERVAFLVDDTGERIDCLLNPETLEATRVAGVRSRHARSGQLVGAGQADDPLHFTGGGRTELLLDLLFDTDLVEGTTGPADVRELTRPLWMLAENSAEQDGAVRPPLVRFVWGKSWNVPGVVRAVAERFDRFTDVGAPRRSWLRLRFQRIAEDADDAAEEYERMVAAAEAQQLDAVKPQPVGVVTETVVAVGSGPARPDFSGVRFDLLAHDALGSPFLWRLLARHNDVQNPLAVASGTTLAVPPSVQA